MSAASVSHSPDKCLISECVSFHTQLRGQKQMETLKLLTVMQNNFTSHCKYTSKWWTPVASHRLMTQTHSLTHRLSRQSGLCKVWYFFFFFAFKMFSNNLCLLPAGLVSSRVSPITEPNFVGKLGLLFPPFSVGLWISTGNINCSSQYLSI